MLLASVLARNLIIAGGGSEAVPPFLFREADIAHLQRNGFIEVDKQVGGSVTYRYGSRAKAIIASYRDTVAKKARDTAALRLGRCHAAASTTDTSPSRRQRPATADFL
jgi:hypothetical protein